MRLLLPAAALALTTICLQSGGPGAGVLPVVRAQGARTVAVISDLHLGVGMDPATRQWHPAEDFRWGDALKSFLRQADETGRGATDLVIDGDAFELLTSLLPGCRPENPRAGCTEAEALARLDRVLAAHAGEVADIGAFAKNRDNRVVFVPGDHDAALLFPSVAARVVAAVAAPGRVSVPAKGYWLSADGSVYAEHGHQVANDPYRFEAWPEPFVRAGGATRLERTWGEALIQDIYDRHESAYPILDNVAEEGGGVKYLASADPTAITGAQLGPLLKFFLSRHAWQQFRPELDGGDVEPPLWDLAAIRKAGKTFLFESLPADDRLRERVERAVKEDGFAVGLDELSDAQIVAVCDYRAAVRRSRRRLERSFTQLISAGPPGAECPRLPDTRGPEFEYFLRSRDAETTAHLAAVRATLAKDGRQTDNLKVVVFGHRHLPDEGFVPVKGAAAPLVLNAGAWQRTVTPFQLNDVATARMWSDADVLRRLTPEDLPACYGVVWIQPPAVPRFRFWRGNGTWGNLPRDAGGFANACTGGGP